MQASSRLTFLLATLAFCSAASFAFGSNRTLAKDEGAVLGKIAKTLGKQDWNFSFDPCNEEGAGNWTAPDYGEYKSRIICDCNGTNDNVCHVTQIILKGQNLRGTLPLEFVNLPYLGEIDLARNYLSGTIPKEWGSSKSLYKISLLGNRLTGPIPVELTNITTLKELVLESNQFYGNLSQELGNFAQIRKLQLSSNNFTGELPETLAKLITLTDFLISDNQFSGQIPNFIQNWTNLTNLYIQGSGLSGPIPSEISSLKNLEELRISDLNGGPESTFPLLDSMTSLEILILRSCNINGPLPDYFGKFLHLKTVDLSFNKLTGPISKSLSDKNATFVFLTGNLLNGTVPGWYKDTRVDLSYNNFSTGNAEQDGCQDRYVNLFASSSVLGNSSGRVSCLKSVDCGQKSYYSFHINCGGNLVNYGDTMYDKDLNTAGVATYTRSDANWVVSSTGYFLDNEKREIFTESKNPELSMPNVDDLYMTARLSPTSLTYYGFCLANGNYTVNLHFAEIMFSDDESYSSLGRRVFDVYIQGKRERKDFNIANEAGGVGKPIIKNFNALVTDNTLEIRLQWAGKGTTVIPVRSVYGPLISAISVESHDKPPENGSSLSAGALVGIVAAGVIIIILVFALLRHLKQKSFLTREVQALNLQTSLFSLRQIKTATNNFDITNKIGEGGFGPVYKGVLSDGTRIAVKKLSSKSKQGNREFINEIGLISAVQHPCLVKLYGCCVEGDQLLLIYEYMENNSLARALFGQENCQIKLDWPTRHNICVGIARGLAYLHEESRLKIVHRDIKATNVLLDKDLNPKISDFGLAKLDEDNNTHISTKIAGTYGYMAPEYAMHGHLTDKADVYSFGIVTLEIISGSNNTIRGSKDQSSYLLDWAHILKEKGNLMELVDPRLGSDLNKDEAMVMIKVGLLCANPIATLRPTMSSVVSMLEGRVAVPELVAESSEVLDEKKLETMRLYYQQMEEYKESEIQKHSASMDGPWTASSSSAADLYPLHLDSSYWVKRE